MDDLRLTVMFCEDVRIEQSGNPIILGALTPVFYSEAPDGAADRLMVLTSVTAPWSLTNFTARLDIITTTSSGEVSTEDFSLSIKRPDDVLENEDWSAFMPLNIRDNVFEHGRRVKAVFAVEDKQTYASVLMQRMSEED